MTLREPGFTKKTTTKTKKGPHAPPADKMKRRNIRKAKKNKQTRKPSLANLRSADAGAAFLGQPALGGAGLDLFLRLAEASTDFFDLGSSPTLENGFLVVP